MLCHSSSEYKPDSFTRPKQNSDSNEGPRTSSNGRISLFLSPKALRTVWALSCVFALHALDDWFGICCTFYGVIIWPWVRYAEKISGNDRGPRQSCFNPGSTVVERGAAKNCGICKLSLTVPLLGRRTTLLLRATWEELSVPDNLAICRTLRLVFGRLLSLQEYVDAPSHSLSIVFYYAYLRGTQSLILSLIVNPDLFLGWTVCLLALSALSASAVLLFVRDGFWQKERSRCLVWDLFVFYLIQLSTGRLLITRGVLWGCLQKGCGEPVYIALAKSSLDVWSHPSGPSSKDGRVEISIYFIVLTEEEVLRTRLWIKAAQLLHDGPRFSLLIGLENRRKSDGLQNEICKLSPHFERLRILVVGKKSKKRNLKFGLSRGERSERDSVRFSVQWEALLRDFYLLKSGSLDLISSRVVVSESGGRIRELDIMRGGRVRSNREILGRKAELTPVVRRNGCVFVKELWNTRYRSKFPSDSYVFSWRARRDKLPTRVNLSRRGVLLDSHLCPLCNPAMEDVQHVFFRCDVARGVFVKVVVGRDWYSTARLCSFSDLGCLVLILSDFLPCLKSI
ncbi:RNA-directed DNA polymerase, eukaryota [Tanacetum coccineum]